MAGQGTKAGTIGVILLLVLPPMYSIADHFSTQASIRFTGRLVLVPHGLTLNAYKLIIEGGIVGRALLIGLAMATVGTGFSMVVTVLAASGCPARAGSGRAGSCGSCWSRCSSTAASSRCPGRLRARRLDRTGR